MDGIISVQQVRTEIFVSDAARCCATALTMHATEGSKKEATSELCSGNTNVCWIIFGINRYHAPHELQLTRANIQFGVEFTHRGELYKMWGIHIPEAELCLVIKSFSD
jgi:hypothetical protein